MTKGLLTGKLETNILSENKIKAMKPLITVFAFSFMFTIALGQCPGCPHCRPEVSKQVSLHDKKPRELAKFFPPGGPAVFNSESEGNNFDSEFFCFDHPEAKEGEVCITNVYKLLSWERREDGGIKIFHASPESNTALLYALGKIKEAGLKSARGGEYPCNIRGNPNDYSPVFASAKELKKRRLLSRKEYKDFKNN